MEPPTPADTTAETSSSTGRRAMVLSLALGLAFVVGAVTVTALVSSPPQEAGVTAEGDGPRLGPVSGPDQTPLPDAELEAFDEGEPVRVRDLIGEPLLINFWATWCAPCVAEMPDLQQVAEETTGRVRFLGVNYREPDRDAARRFVDELGITYQLAADPAGEFLTAVRGFGMPTTLFVDPTGTIVYRHTGALSIEALRDLIGEHLDVEP